MDGAGYKSDKYIINTYIHTDSMRQLAFTVLCSSFISHFLHCLWYVLVYTFFCLHCILVSVIPVLVALFTGHLMLSDFIGFTFCNLSGVSVRKVG